jgi:3-oxoadipate enol-lactonase
MMSMRNDQAEKSTDVIRGERLQLAARKGHDVADRLHVITCPTFVTAGKFDGIAPPINSEAIVERISDATLSLYEGGHMFLAQDPSAIREIRIFLTTGVRPGNK